MSPYKLVNVSKQHHEQNTNHLSTIAVTSTRNEQNKNRLFKLKGRIVAVLRDVTLLTMSPKNILQCVVVQHCWIVMFAAKTQQSLCLLRNRPMTEKKFTKVVTLTDEIYNKINTLEKLLVRKSLVRPENYEYTFSWME